VLLGGCAAGGGLDLPLAGALVATSAELAGNGLTGLSIFTIVLSNSIPLVLNWLIVRFIGKKPGNFRVIRRTY
jgi:hypothetical protein